MALASGATSGTSANVEKPFRTICVSVTRLVNTCASNSNENRARGARGVVFGNSVGLEREGAGRASRRKYAREVRRRKGGEFAAQRFWRIKRCRAGAWRISPDGVVVVV
jgi:hypothetical protein